MPHVVPLEHGVPDVQVLDLPEGLRLGAVGDLVEEGRVVGAQDVAPEL